MASFLGGGVSSDDCDCLLVGALGIGSVPFYEVFRDLQRDEAWCSDFPPPFPSMDTRVPFFVGFPDIN